jgi:hypothetical protein
MDLAEMRGDEESGTPAQAGPDTSVFGDIPGPIWSAFLIAWALLFGLFLVAFARDGRATIAVVTSCFFALMILGLPAMIGRGSKPSSRHWPSMIKTRNGPIPVTAAATQILLIPFAAVFGILAFIILAL